MELTIMRIIYFHHSHTHNDIRIIKSLATEYEVIIVSYYKKKIVFPRIKTIQIQLPRPFISYPIGMPITRYIFSKIKFDVVIATYLTTYGFYAAWANIKPLITITMGNDIFINPKVPLLNAITRFSIQKSNHIISDSKMGIQTLLKLGAISSQLKQIPWGVDINLFSKQVRKRNFWKNKKIVICTRKHEKIYGINYLIESIPNILKTNNNIRFLLIGDGQEHNKYIRLINKLNLKEYVKCLGNVNYNKIPQLLTNSDIYISPSLSDGSSISLLEAMASKLPIVATDIPANREWISEWLIPPRNSQAIADAILYYIDNITKLNEIVDKNKKTIEQRGDFKQSIDALIKLIGKVSNK